MDLRRLMDHGFLIYQQDAIFVLKKIPTPKNATGVVRDLVASDNSMDTFTTFEAAAARAEELLEPHATWDVQVMYKHIGFGSQIKNLEQVAGATYDEAMIEARTMAETIFGNDESVESWDVRIRPAQCL